MNYLIRHENKYYLTQHNNLLNFVYEADCFADINEIEYRPIKILWEDTPIKVPNIVAEEMIYFNNNKFKFKNLGKEFNKRY